MRALAKYYNLVDRVDAFVTSKMKEKYTCHTGMKDYVSRVGENSGERLSLWWILDVGSLEI